MAELLETAPGLSGHSVRATAENTLNSIPDSGQSLENTVHNAVELVENALDLTGKAMGQAVEMVSDKAFQGAAEVGVNIATPASSTLGQSSFSWSGYMQALGILCLLLGALWFGTWLIRRYGKFNFLPRPGNLPRDALVMEAQMPLGPKKGLMVVRFLNRRLLLGVTEHQISLLTEETTSDNGQAKDFQGILANARNAGADSSADNRLA